MNPEDLRLPVFWLATDIGVIMGPGNNHDTMLNKLYPDWRWSHGNRPWQHQFASGEIETTNALGELLGDDVDTRGDIYIKMRWDTDASIEELAVAVATEAREQDVYLSGLVVCSADHFTLAQAEQSVAAKGRPDFVERWRLEQRRLGGDL